MAPSRPRLSEEAKRILQKERRSLQRRSAADAEERISNARREITLAQERLNRVHRATNENAFLRSVHALISAVESSWGLSVPIDISATPWWSTGDVEAVTDFKSIIIRYPGKLIPQSERGFHPTVLANAIADIKGIAYHEIGHNLFTVPYPDLVKLAEGEGFIFPVDRTSSQFHWSWNVLEDQRMETAMVRESPVLVDYYTTMVLTHLLKEADNAGTNYIGATQWALIAGRRYLPRPVRNGVRERFASLFGADNADQIALLIHKYMVATSASEMLRNVVAFKDLFDSLNLQMPQGNDRHTFTMAGTNGATGEQMQQRIQQSASDPSAGEPQDGEKEDSDESVSSAGDGEDEQEADGSDGGQDGDESDGDTPATSRSRSKRKADNRPAQDDGDDTDGDDPSDGDDTNATARVPGNGVSNSGDDSPLEDVVQQALDQSNARRLGDASIQAAVRDVYETVGSEEVPLPRNVSLPQMQDQALREQSVMLASQLEQALNVYLAETAPIWQNRQPRGVIDPFAYRTRISGSQDYRRLYEEGDIGVDMSVTLALDVSGSMAGWDDHLGAAAYATKSACDALRIPCSVVEFNHTARLIWLPNDAPDLVSIRCDGGTIPTEAMESLSYLTYDKSYHLIVVMTDGEFDKSFPGFGFYKDDNRFFLGLAFGHAHLRYSLERQGADEAHSIGDLLQIPEIISNFIAARVH